MYENGLRASQYVVDPISPLEICHIFSAIIVKRFSISFATIVYPIKKGQRGMGFVL